MNLFQDPCYFWLQLALYNYYNRLLPDNSCSYGLIPMTLLRNLVSSIAIDQNVFYQCKFEPYWSITGLNFWFISLNHFSTRKYGFYTYIYSIILLYLVTCSAVMTSRVNGKFKQKCVSPHIWQEGASSSGIISGALLPKG